MAYTLEDLTVMDDPVALIRRHPRMYGGEFPRAARIAATMAGGLLQFGMKSVSAEAFGAWWLITSQADWLTIGGVCHAEYWHRIVAAPELGLEAMRPEVLLTAFSTVLFTVAGQSMEFIVGGKIGDEALQRKVRKLEEPAFSGRAVGFLVSD